MSAAGDALPIRPGDPVNILGSRVGEVLSVSGGVVEAELDDDVVLRMVQAGVPQASVQMVLNALA